MEPSSQQPLATDSFSYSWLTNPTPSFDALIESLRPSFDNYNDSPINEFMKNTLHNHRNDFDEDFDFNTVLPEPKSSDSLIHADELFSGGCIMPVYPNQQPTISVTSTPASSITSITECSEAKQRRQSPCFFLKRFKESSNRVLRKSVLIFSKLGCSREGVRVADLDRKVKEIRRRSNLNQSSPDSSRAGTGAGTGAGAEARAFDSDIYSDEIKRKSKKYDAYKRLRDVRSCNNSPLTSPPRSLTPSMDPWHYVECSIDDAILHCKRSFASN